MSLPFSGSTNKPKRNREAGNKRSSSVKQENSVEQVLGKLAFTILDMTSADG
jgi:hypothetical protein